MADEFSFEKLFSSAKGIMEKAEENFSKITATSEGGAGLVRATVNAHDELIKLELDDALLKESKETIEELIVATINAAHEKVEEEKSKNLKSFGSLLRGKPENEEE